MIATQRKPRALSKPGSGRIRCANCREVIWAGHQTCPKCGQPARVEVSTADEHAGNGKAVAHAVDLHTPFGTSGGVDQAPIRTVVTFMSDDALDMFKTACVFATRCGGIKEAKRLLQAIEDGLALLPSQKTRAAASGA